MGDKRKSIPGTGGQGGSGTKRRKVDHANEEEEELGDEEDNETLQTGPVDPPTKPPRHRVTTKGLNVPSHAETFEALKERYHISSHILANLNLNGYAHPTGIQSYGIPILLEVGLPHHSAQDLRSAVCAVPRPRGYFPNRDRKDALIPSAYLCVDGHTRVQCEGHSCGSASLGSGANARTRPPNTQRVSEACTRSEVENCALRQGHCKYSF